MRSFLSFTGPVDGEEAQAKVSEMILYECPNSPTTN